MAEYHDNSGSRKSSTEEDKLDEDEEEEEQVQLPLHQYCANENLRSIVEFMLDAKTHSDNLEVTLSVRKFLNRYPQVTSAGFSDDGAYQNEYNLVRDARCFYMVYQYNINTKGPYHKKVKKTHASFVQNCL